MAFLDEVPGIQMPQTKPRSGGMFGASPNWGNAIQAAIGGYLAGRGAPGGAQILSQLHQRQMMAQQQAMEEANYSRQRQDGMQDWMAKQQYEAAHPQPDDFTQKMIHAGIDPNSDQAKALYLQAVQNAANPFQAITRENPDGSQVREFMRPPMAPIAPVGRLIPIDGGPTPQASGGFPSGGY